MCLTSTVKYATAQNQSITSKFKEEVLNFSRGKETTVRRTVVVGTTKNGLGSRIIQTVD
jgi:hypothetical protein